jgi:hypothetical protein
MDMELTTLNVFNSILYSFKGLKINLGTQKYKKYFELQSKLKLLFVVKHLSQLVRPKGNTCAGKKFATLIRRWSKTKRRQYLPVAEI